MDDLFTELNEYGVKVDELLRRCDGNEENLQKYLRLYVRDNSYQNIIESLEQMDMAAFASSVHALKGAAGNIGITPVYQTALGMDQYLKGDRADIAIRMVPKLKEEYLRSVDIIMRYLP